MLFNSREFIFIFMPTVLIGFALLSRANHRIALGWLVASSFAFYGYWHAEAIWILVVSICFNFATGFAIEKFGFPRTIFIFGVACNLSALAYFKYAGFAADIVQQLGAAIPKPEVSLPLGISFFTFTQIAYLVDVYRDLARDHDPLRYSLFVTYFPHLIAGPILHHKPTMQQFANPQTAKISASNWLIGFLFFSIGLSKKLLIADPLGAIANGLFSAAQASEITIVVGWVAILSYTFQIYFDFSGYSDMAVGLSLLFGVRIPINFLSPYKAVNIIDFWRCWHISLSTFLRDYLYIPLGGSRSGPLRRYLNLFITMVLGGLWHGAGWTFVVWGALHGLYLLCNHAWRELVGIRVLPIFGWLLTFFSVAFAWIFFRSPDLATANRIIVSTVTPYHVGWIWTADPNLHGLNPGYVVILLLAALVISVGLPNALQITSFVERSLGSSSVSFQALAWVTTCSLLFGAGIVCLGRASPFLYFQF